MLKRMLVLLSALCLFTGVQATHAQQREIRGTVVHATDGRPLPGANVLLAGTNIGTITGPTGNFVLAVPAGDVRLRVRLIGYRSTEIEVAAGQSTVNVGLEQDVLDVEGVVVTGQATTVARRNLANAVATVTAQELTPVTAQTVDKALQGKIAGANIQTNSGAPGGGVQVNLRGVSSINASAEPLWVIDGVVVSNVAIASGANAVTAASAGSNASNQDAPVNRIADINPEDIERIEVLKGASASAIYGSQASNGVIIVTTKRGQAGAPQMNVTQRVGAYQLSNKLGMRSWTRDEAVAAFGTGAAAYFNADGTPRQVFDLEDELAGRRDLSTETIVTINGGTEDTRYYVSGLWQDDAGIIPNTGFGKQSIRLNLDQRLGSRIDLGVNANVMHSLARRGLTNNDNTGTSFYMVFPFTPNFVDLRRQADGTFPENPFERSNPLQTAELMTNDEDVWRLISAGNASVDLIATEQQSLRLLVTGGVDYFQQKNTLFFPPELQFEPLDRLPGTSLLSNSDNLFLNGNANLVHTFTPAGGFLTATTSAGVQYGDQDLSTVRNIGRNLIAGQRHIDAATSLEVFAHRQRVRTLGLYLQEELLMLDDRLLLTGSVRADRSSSAGDPERFFLYPKASASFRLPGLMQGLDELKLRAAFGASGNQPLFGQKFTPLEATNNIQGLPGLVLQGIAGDPDIRPERTREIEGGFDAFLFNGNATFEFTVYQQNITDLLLQRAVAWSTGFTTQFFNGGELETRGIEIGLGATPIRTRDFSWFSRATFSSNRSVIVDLPVPAFRAGGFGTALGAFQIEQGRSATQIVGNDGLDAEGRVVVNPLGDANPDFRMGFANDLSFRGFSLYSLWDWQQGGNLINLTKLLYDFGQNTPDFPLPAGVPEPRPVPECHPNCSGVERLEGFGVYAKQYVEDGSFLKLRELSLSYTLPPALFAAAGIGVRGAQLSLSGRNLLTFTNYTGLDPEVSNFGNQSIARNIDVAPFPPSRSFWLSLNLGF